MFKVKIFGAGSIGNHLAYASRHLGFDVTVCDIDESALNRMRNEIYPTRYGSWDETIKLFRNDQAPKGGFDMIIIGTPPEYHIPLALEAMKEQPRAVLLEKPVCTPSLDGAQELYAKSKKSITRFFVGYTYVTAKAMNEVEKILKTGGIGDVLTLDVDCREHWEGIFRAHPWLEGPQDTYLGSWQKGGGASGEHSHAMNLWQHLAQVLGFGRVIEMSANISYVKDGPVCYDDKCLLNLKTEKGLLGRVAQDVVTSPPIVRVWIQGTRGQLEWIANYDQVGDAIIIQKNRQPKEIVSIPKKRPDGFIAEIRHVCEFTIDDKEDSPLRLERGLDTMMVIAAAHESDSQKRTVRINYEQGYQLNALECGAK